MFTFEVFSFKVPWDPTLHVFPLAKVSIWLGGSQPSPWLSLFGVWWGFPFNPPKTLNFKRGI